jgi:hypothetical protein
MVDHPQSDDAGAAAASSSSSSAVTHDIVTAAGILSSPVEPSSSLAAELAGAPLVRDRYRPFQTGYLIARISTKKMLVEKHIAFNAKRPHSLFFKSYPSKKSVE